MAEEVKYPTYRWVILFIGWLILASLMISWFAVVVRAYDLIPGLSLTPAQFGLIVTAPTLAAIFLSIPGGMLGDRFGIKWVVGLTGVICVVAGILRMSASSFGLMFGCQLGIGLAYCVAFSNLPKMVAIWFPPKEVGLATGLFITGMGIGQAGILAFGAAFSTWQQTMLNVGIIMAVVTILWFLFARAAPAVAPAGDLHAAGRVGVMESLAYNFKQKNTWLIGIAYFLILGAFTCITGSFPYMLGRVHRISPGVAGAISSTLIFAMLGGHIIGPTVSDRIGLRKPILYVSMVGTAICVFFAWLTAMSTATWIFLIIGGLFLGSGFPIVFTFPVELPGVGPKWAGGCMGIILAIGNVGAFVTMPYIFTPVAETNPTLGYGIMALFLVATILPMLLVPEVGARARAEQRL
jgi:nitrate/nitrite transporter NarK